MNNPEPNQQENVQHELQQCQLCGSKVKANDTYAGSFDRICHACYQLQIEDLQHPIHQIIDGLFIGSMKATRDQPLLRQYKIGAICICGSELKVHDYQQLKVQKKILKILDTQNQDILKHLPQVVSWISSMRNKKLNVLVHCAGGVSRSASVCIAYLMQCHKLPYKQSYLLVKRGRKCIKPNQNFVKQLKNYEKMVCK